MNDALLREKIGQRCHNALVEYLETIENLVERCAAAERDYFVDILAPSGGASLIRTGADEHEPVRILRDPELMNLAATFMSSALNRLRGQPRARVTEAISSGESPIFHTIVDLQSGTIDFCVETLTNGLHPLQRLEARGDGHAPTIPATRH